MVVVLLNGIALVMLVLGWVPQYLSAGKYPCQYVSRSTLTGH